MILSLFLPSLNVSNYHIADSIMNKLSNRGLRMYDLSKFDFSKSKVRYCGNVLSKFELCSVLDDLEPYGVNVHLLYDVETYTYFKTKLLNLVS